MSSVIGAMAQRIREQAAPGIAAAAAAKQRAMNIDTGAINATAAPAGAAASTALSQVTDPGRFAAAEQARNLQNGIVGYGNSVMSGQSPLVTAMQRQQGEAAGQGALVASALSNQNGMAPGLTQRNTQAAQAQLHGSIAAGAQANDIMAQRSALDASGAAATAMRGTDQTQALGAGAQQLQGAGLVATTGENAANRDTSGQIADQSAYYMARGQDTGAATAAANLAQSQAQWQQTNDANNNWWNKYALPTMSLGATVGAGALAGSGRGGPSDTPSTGEAI